MYKKSFGRQMQAAGHINCLVRQIRNQTKTRQTIYKITLALCLFNLCTT